MSAAAQTAFTTPSRAPLIRQLQWVSMDSAILFFAISSLAGGARQTCLSRATALATTAFELALLSLERRNQRRTISTEPIAPGSEANIRPALAEEQDRPISLTPPLPTACRRWAIALRTLLVLGWALASALAIMQHFIIRRTSAYAIFMTIWIVIQLGVVGVGCGLLSGATGGGCQVNGERPGYYDAGWSRKLEAATSLVLTGLKKFLGHSNRGRCAYVLE